MPKKLVSSVRRNIPKPKERTELSVLDSVGEGIGDLKAEADRQEEEAQRYAVAFLQKVMRLKGVAIERDHFLRSEFRKRGVSDERVELAISTSPASAGLDSGLVDSIAMDVIDFETKKSTVLSFSAGLPGGARDARNDPGGRDAVLCPRLSNHAETSVSLRLAVLHRRLRRDGR